jgi:RIH domain
MYVHTSVGILKKNIPYLCMGVDQIPKERFNQMDQIMKSLDAFAKCEEGGHDLQVDGDEGGSSDFDMNTLKDKIIRRQKIMRELYLCEYIV